MRVIVALIAAVVALAAFPHKLQARGSGEAYGARDPMVCRPLERSAAPSPAEAADLVRCRIESESGGELWLMKDVSVRVAGGRPYDYLTDSTVGQIDPSQPVHDLRGSFTWSVCITRASAESYGRDPSRNCYERDVPVAVGSCWRTTFGEWACALGGAVAGDIRQGTPPLK